MLNKTNLNQKTFPSKTHFIIQKANTYIERNFVRECDFSLLPGCPKVLSIDLPYCRLEGSIVRGCYHHPQCPHVGSVNVEPEVETSGAGWVELDALQVGLVTTFTWK